MTAPDLFAFLDYRAFLRAWFEDRAGRPSMRQFAGQVDCSPALVSSILSAARDLDPFRAEAFATRLGLDPEERVFFLHLVEFNQATTRSRRQAALDELLAQQRFYEAQRIEGDLYALFSRWYLGAIAELARCEGFRADPAWVAAKLFPPITEAEAEAGLATLLRLGVLVARDGAVVHGGDGWATEHQASRDLVSLALVQQHLWMLGRAQEALDQVATHERHYGTLTFAVDEARLPELKQRIAELERQAMRIGSQDDGVRARVYQLGVQLFPVSEPTTE